MSTREQFLQGQKNSVVITPYEPCSVGPALIATGNGVAPASTATVANVAYFVPFVVYSPITITKISWFGAAGANADVGIYTESGTKVISTGAVADAAGLQTVDIADTYLSPGRYYYAYSSSAVHSISMFPTAGLAAALTPVFGVLEQTSAHPLPATATFATTTRQAFPIVILTVSPRTVV